MTILIALFVLITKALLSFVPRKFSAGKVPALPLSDQKAAAVFGAFVESSSTEMISSLPFWVMVTFSPAVNLTSSFIELILLTTSSLAILLPVMAPSATERANKLYGVAVSSMR